MNLAEDHAIARFANANPAKSRAERYGDAHRDADKNEPKSADACKVAVLRGSARTKEKEPLKSGAKI